MLIINFLFLENEKKKCCMRDCLLHRDVCLLCVRGPRKAEWDVLFDINPNSHQAGFDIWSFYCWRHARIKTHSWVLPKMLDPVGITQPCQAGIVWDEGSHWLGGSVFASSHVWCLRVICDINSRVRGSLNKFPDFFRMGTFIDSIHMKL